MCLCVCVYASVCRFVRVRVYTCVYVRVWFNGSFNRNGILRRVSRFAGFNALGYFWRLLYATATHIAELSECDLMTFETRA